MELFSEDAAECGHLLLRGSREVECGHSCLLRMGGDGSEVDRKVHELCSGHSEGGRPGHHRGQNGRELRRRNPTTPCHNQLDEAVIPETQCRIYSYREGDLGN